MERRRQGTCDSQAESYIFKGIDFGAER